MQMLIAIDGKHPPDRISLNYNYKESYSIVLMAIANAKKELIMVLFCITQCFGKEHK